MTDLDTAEAQARSTMRSICASEPGVRLLDLVARTRDHLIQSGHGLHEQRITAVFWTEVSEGAMHYTTDGRAFRA